MIDRRPLIIMCLLIAILSGCGYTAKHPMPDKYKTIYIPAVRNDVGELAAFKAKIASGDVVSDHFEYNLQAPLTDAIRRYFSRGSRPKVVNSKSVADLVLEMAILGYELDPLSDDDYDNVAEYRVIVKAAAVLSKGNGEILWTEQYLTGTSTFISQRILPTSGTRGPTGYFLSESRSFPTRNQSGGTAEALEDLASNTWLRVVEFW